MAGRLTIEVDEDVQLVETAAAPTLFSPGMWVQRPSRTPAAATRDMELPDRPAGGLAMELAAAAAASASTGDGVQPAEQSQPSQPGRPSAAGLGSPLADPDLAYLNIADDQERAEREYLQQDSEHIAALESEYARLSEQNCVLEQQLKGMLASRNDAAEENRTIKQLLAMLQVRREDFVFNPQQTIAAQQEAIGMRLLRNLEGSPPSAPPLPQQHQQHQHQHQQQHQQQQQQSVEQEHEKAASVAAAAAFDMTSPGGLLSIPGTDGRDSTPANLLRTVSPKIAAFRQQDLQAPAAGAQQQQQQPAAPPTVVPASPYDFPAEAQIAAAALTAKQGDAAAALLTLLDKAVEGRMERQQAAATVAAAAAAAASQQHGHMHGQQLYRGVS